MRKALIVSGVVVNVIELAPGVVWSPPNGYTVVDAGTAGGVGDTWNGTAFIPRVQTAEELAEIAEVATIETTFLQIGRAALANWATLTAAQKDAILRGALRYILHKEVR